MTTPVLNDRIFAHYVQFIQIIHCTGFISSHSLYFCTLYTFDWNHRLLQCTNVSTFRVPLHAMNMKRLTKCYFYCKFTFLQYFWSTCLVNKSEGSFSKMSLCYVLMLNIGIVIRCFWTLKYQYGSLKKPILVGSSIYFSMLICILECNVNPYLVTFLISSYLFLFFYPFFCCADTCPKTNSYMHVNKVCHYNSKVKVTCCFWISLFRQVNDLSCQQ